MAFNYATGQYEPDQPAAAPQAGPTMNDWFRLAGYGQQDPNMNYSSQAGGGGSSPGLLNGGVVDPIPAGTVPNPGVDRNNQNHQAPAPNMPSYDNPYVNMGQVLTPQTEAANQPGAAPQSPMQIFSQNAGTTFGSPALAGDFWSNTAGHYVDPTGNTDATGRVLSDAEKQYWQGYDHARASGTLDSYLKTVTNPGLAAGTQATYAPGVATTTIPGRTLDQTGAPAANPAANPAAAAAGQPAAAAGQPNPLDPAWDYSKAGAVPWQAFIKNLFADANAQQSFKELQGVLTPQQVDQASKLYGWQPIVGSAGTDANAVFRAAIQAAQADPASDYSIVRMQNPTDGTVSLGVMKRSQSTATQEAGGFYAPGSTNPNSPANIAHAAAARNATTYSKSGTGTGAKPAATGGGVTQAQLQSAAGMGGLSRGVLSTAAYLKTLQDKNAFNGATATGTASNPAYKPAQGTGASNTPGVPQPQPSQHNQQPLLDAVARAAAALKAGAAPAPLQRGTPYGTISQDGHWRWDGTQWQFAG